MILSNVSGKIIAVDFDNTLTIGGSYPITGKMNIKVVNIIKQLQNNNKIILWTCRTGKDLDEALKMCYDTGLVFDAVNENICGNITSNKIFADYYIDDKAVNINSII